VNDQLQERAGILIIFPRRRYFARTQTDDHIAYPDSLPGFHLQITPQAVTLVEDTDDRFALLHRRYCTHRRGRLWGRLCRISERRRFRCRGFGSRFGRRYHILQRSRRLPAKQGQAQAHSNKQERALHGTHAS
jgi:hypothetical protein